MKSERERRLSKPACFRIWKWSPVLCLYGLFGKTPPSDAEVVNASVGNSSTRADYRFEEGADGQSAASANAILDSSGNGLNGTPVGSAAYSSNIPEIPVPTGGKPKLRSLAFDGSSGRIFIPDYPLLEITNSLTVEAWINAASPGRGINGFSQIVFRGDDRCALDPYFLALCGTDLYFEITDTEGVTSVVRAPITINNWHHVAGTLDDVSGKQSLYIDGVLVAQGITFQRPMGTLIGTNPGLGIGNLESQTYDEYFDGLIAEVRISAKALMPNEFLNARPVITVTHRPRPPHESLNARSTFMVTHQAPPTTEILTAQPVIIVAPPVNIGGILRIDFEVADVSTPSFMLLHADQLERPWSINTKALLTTNVVNQSYSFTLAVDTNSTEFYRVQTQ